MRSTTHQTGLCCRCFTLPVSPEELWENYIHWIVEGWADWLNQTSCAIPSRDANGQGLIENIEWLIEHLRYIGYRSWKFAYQEHILTEPTILHFYTCDLLNIRTGRCQDYENRHPMCSTYMHCEHPDTCESLWCSCHPISQLIEEYKRDIIQRPFDLAKLHKKFKDEI